MTPQSIDQTQVRFDASVSSGIRIIDPIENAQFVLYTSDDVTPTPASTSRYSWPVDQAVTFETTSIEIPALGLIFLHGADSHTEEFRPVMEPRTIDGEYVIELAGPPMKLYLALEGQATVASTESSITVSVADPCEFWLGARSFHESPAATITTPPDVESVMEAMSYLGTSLKSQSPERSYPTLRGHPPAFELGEELTIPAGLTRPKTGITLELPPTYESVYPAAPLAFYLGATVVPAPKREPSLVVNGERFSLIESGTYEQTVHRVLHQLFTLDCVTRTEGIYQIDLHEREVIESLVDLNFEELYHRPLTDQVKAFLEVPYSTIHPHLPEWPLTVDIEPHSEYRDLIPYLASDLAFIRCQPEPKSVDIQESAVLDKFYRMSAESPPADSIRNLDDVETTSHAWIGDGYSLDANKITPQSYHRRLTYTPSDSRINVHVVCNDSLMSDEGVVGEYYGLRDLLEFDVTVHYELTTAELRSLIDSPIDFLHFIGHVDDEGMLCTDGSLDARTIDDVQVKAFLLNACRSFEQGQALIDKGSYAGVVTLTGVVNSVATNIGQAFARLLNSGFPFRIAIELAQIGTLGYEYIVLGDGSLNLCQPESGSPTHTRIQSIDDGYSVEIVCYTGPGYQIGSTYHPNIPDVENHYIGSGTIDTYELSIYTLEEFLEMELMPVESNHQLFWSDNCSIDDL